MDRVKPETIPSAVPLLSQPVWLQLSPAVRSKLVQLFGLKRSGATETYMGRDSVVRVVSDGYTAADLLVVTKEKMQEILGTDSTDFYGMFDDVLANIDALLEGSFLSRTFYSDSPAQMATGLDLKDLAEKVDDGVQEPKVKRKYTKRAK